MKNVRPVYPPPGLSLRAPTDLDVETFCKQIGGDCDDIADKFETIDEVFTQTTVSNSSSKSDDLGRLSGLPI